MSARFKSRYVELAATVILDFPRQLSFDYRLLRTFSIVRGSAALYHTHLYFVEFYTAATLCQLLSSALARLS